MKHFKIEDYIGPLFKGVELSSSASFTLTSVVAPKSSPQRFIAIIFKSQTDKDFSQLASETERFAELRADFLIHNRKEYSRTNKQQLRADIQAALLKILPCKDSPYEFRLHSLDDGKIWLRCLACGEDADKFISNLEVEGPSLTNAFDLNYVQLQLGQYGIGTEDLRELLN